MELSSGIRSIEQLPLPPGFRFTPTDEELVWHYLKRQSDSGSFDFRVIAEVELYKFNPWDLPGTLSRRINNSLTSTFNHIMVMLPVMFIKMACFREPKL